jgi:hypothetical protein
MKKILSLLFLLISITGFASHYAGGDIQYRYIGDSTGISNHYKIILITFDLLTFHIFR